jgi:hypothetical protein
MGNLIFPSPRVIYKVMLRIDRHKLRGINLICLALLPFLLIPLVLSCPEDFVQINGSINNADDMCDCHMPVLPVNDGINFVIPEIASIHPHLASLIINLFTPIIYHPPQA